MAANAEQIDESLKRQALAEEEAAMNQYKKSTNPFLSSPTSATAPSLTSGGRHLFWELNKDISFILFVCDKKKEPHLKHSNIISLSSICLAVM